MTVLNDLDIKLLEYFQGYTVKKDLVRFVNVGANVPPIVLGNTDLGFYQNNQMLMQKTILLD